MCKSKNAVSVDVTPRIHLKVNRRFGGTCRLHLEVRKLCQAASSRYQAELVCTRFLFGLFFEPEDEGDILLRNVSILPM
jgi:hypothetical protein